MYSCLLSLEECDKTNPCSLHHLAYKEKQKIIEKLNKTTLNELADHIKKGKSILPL
jgi:DNA-binding IscR family transcriptional regulator